MGEAGMGEATDARIVGVVRLEMQEIPEEEQGVEELGGHVSAMSEEPEPTNLGDALVELRALRARVAELEEAEAARVEAAARLAAALRLSKYALFLNRTCTKDYLRASSRYCN